MKRYRKRLGGAAVILIAVAMVLYERSENRIWVTLPGGTELLEPQFRHGTNVVFRLGNATENLFWNVFPDRELNHLNWMGFRMERPSSRINARISNAETALWMMLRTSKKSIGADQAIDLSVDTVRATVSGSNGVEFPVLFPQRFRKAGSHGYGFGRAVRFPRTSEPLFLTLKTRSRDIRRSWKEIGRWEFRNPSITTNPTNKNWSLRDSQRIGSVDFQIGTVRASLCDWAETERNAPFPDLRWVSQTSVRTVESGLVSSNWYPILKEIRDDSGNYRMNAPSWITTGNSGWMTMESPLCCDPTRRWRVEVEFADLTQLRSVSSIRVSNRDGQSRTNSIPELLGARVETDLISRGIHLKGVDAGWAIIPDPIRWEGYWKTDAPSDRRIHQGPSTIWQGPSTLATNQEFEFGYSIAPSKTVVFFVDPVIQTVE